MLETAMVEGAHLEQTRKMISMCRFGAPEEVAGLVSHLWSDEANYTEDRAISMNGDRV